MDTVPKEGKYIFKDKDGKVEEYILVKKSLLDTLLKEITEIVKLTKG